FPALNQNGNPPSAASVAPASGMTSNGSGTLPNSEPRKVRTLTVHSDQPDGAALPTSSVPAAPKPGQAARNTPAAPTQRTPPTSANASAAPMALVPADSPPADPRTRVANTNPAPPAQPSAPGTPSATGSYLVQVSSQRNEADAQASYRALQGKFPAVLGSHSPVIKRADLGDKRS